MSAGHGTRGESTESPSHAAGGDANGAILAGLLSIVGQLEQDNRALARRVGYLRAQLEHAHNALGARERPPAAARRELIGTLDGIGLVSLVGFLAGLNAGGCLTISDGPFTGVVFFEAGRAIGATFGPERGWAALEAMGLLLGHGRFVFSDAPGERQLNLTLEPVDLQYRLHDLAQESARLAALIPSLAAVPRFIVDEAAPEAPIRLERSALMLLQRVDGRQSVADLARSGEIVPTLRQLARLVELDLIRLELSEEAAPATAPPPPREAAGLGQLERWARAVRTAAGLSRELVQVALLIVVLFVLTRPLVRSFRVEGSSMAPTLQNGQMLLINKAAYWRVDGTPLEDVLPAARQGWLAFPFGGPQRGDVAVFGVPDELAEQVAEQDLVKRIIGLPGDVVLIEQGVVFVNGSRLDEPYVHTPATDTYPGDDRPTRVPDGSYFVLGDNRPSSADSRLGWFVPADSLVGRAWLSYWPPTRWTLVSQDGKLGQAASPQANLPSVGS